MEELEPSLRYELGVPLGVLCDNPWQATALADDEYEWVVPQHAHALGDAHEERVTSPVSAAWWNPPLSTEGVECGQLQPLRECRGVVVQGGVRHEQWHDVQAPIAEAAQGGAGSSTRGRVRVARGRGQGGARGGACGGAGRGGARPDDVEPRTGERLHAREPCVVECLDQSALALDFGSLGRPLGSVPLWARHKLAKRCHCQCEACADAPAHQNFQLPGTPTPQQLRATCCFGGGTPTPRLRATCCEAFSHPCGCWPGADGFRTSTLLIRPGAWLAGRKCWNAAAELLSGEVQDHVLANLPDDTPRMHALWIGVLVGLEHAQCTASVDTLLDLRLADEGMVQTLHVLYSRIAAARRRIGAARRKSLTGLPHLTKMRTCYIAAEKLLREWPGPVRITWVPGAENATAKAVYCARDLKEPLCARQLKEPLQVLPLQGKWLKLVTEMNEN